MGLTRILVFRLEELEFNWIEEANPADSGSYLLNIFILKWFAESMHEERIMEHYESCSQETIKNAIYIYKDMKIIKMTRETSDDMITVIIGEDKVEY